jgi:hypothetical protein
MPDPHAPITLGLSAPAPAPASGQVRPVDELQFHHAERIAGEGGTSAGSQTCVACKQPIAGDYFHAQGQVVCPLCADRIQAGQQAPPSVSLLRAAIYGSGAALAGFLLYSLVAIFTGLEIGLIAIVVGIMVGKTVRYASHGLGGRPQQILAIGLTYFAITTSYIPGFVYQSAKSAKPAAQPDPSKQAAPAVAERTQPRMSAGKAIAMLVGLAMAAPFLSLFSGENPVSSLISLFIIFIGLQRAWALTARPEILIMGPYKNAAP